MSVTLTNLDRVLWPETGFTKGDLVAYYERVAPALLPHLARRALTLWRFPEGVHRRGWWQNECRGAPDWMTVAEIRGQRFCVVDDEPSLVWVANQGTVELHPFGSTVDAPETPLRLLVDLDPGAPAGLVECCRVALAARRSLGEATLVKTSGASGLHLAAPAAATFADTKAVARELAERLAWELPELVVAEQRREARRGRVLVDWLQSDATRTTAAPYSLRATRVPSVSTPVTWDEVEAAAAARDATTLRFGPQDVRARLDRDGDLWSDLALP
ncbi:MAG TPA: non-homologous end-joining DNA ligase [Gaiellaceae bacterium]|nr:non-homologous end-joining DNA ligase [Gaiellaceae bacterium]